MPYWAWVATLVGAIYKGYGAHWLVAAWAGPALFHTVDALMDNGTVSLQNVAVVAAAAWVRLLLGGAPVSVSPSAARLPERPCSCVRACPDPSDQPPAAHEGLPASWRTQAAYRDQATEVAILLGISSVVWNAVISLQARLKEAPA